MAVAIYFTLIVLGPFAVAPLFPRDQLHFLSYFYSAPVLICFYIDTVRGVAGLLGLVPRLGGTESGCSVRGNNTMVDCTDGRLTEIPVSLLSNLTTDLVFSKNRLSAIPTIHLAATPNLRFLDLKSNFITTIEEDAFRTTPFLKELILDGNFALSAIHVHGFRHLSNLVKLSIKLTAVSSLSRSHFEPLTSLQALRLVLNTFITAFSSDLFAAIVALVEVDIAACGKVSNALFTQSLGLSTLPLLIKLYVPPIVWS